MGLLRTPTLKQRFVLLSLSSLGLLLVLAVALGMQLRDVRTTRHRLEEDWKEVRLAFGVMNELQVILTESNGAGEDGRAEWLRTRVVQLADHVEKLDRSIDKHLKGTEAEEEEAKGVALLRRNLAAWEALLEEMEQGSAGRTEELARIEDLVREGTATTTLLTGGALKELDDSLEDLREREEHIDTLLRVAIAGFLGLFVLSAFGFASWILRPIRDLEQMVVRVRRHDFDLKEGRRVRAPGELGELMNHFTEMAQNIRSFTDDLEAQVRDRTAELESSRAQLRQMLDSVPEAVALVEKSGGRILFTNAPWRALFGEGELSPVPTLLALPHGSHGFVDWQPPTGEPRILDIGTMDLATPGGQPPIRLEHVRDLTRQVRTQSALASSQRLAAIGRLSSGMAHEINNPLTAIAACAEGLLKRIGTPRFEEGIVREYLVTIHEEVFRCKEITGKLLESSRPHKPALELLAPCEVLEGLVKLAAPLASRSGVDLSVTECSEEPLLSDAGALRQILLNLVLNAVEACEGNGSVGLSCVQSKDCHEFRVEDNGRGIEEADRAQLFEPFFSKRTDGNGTGLGLFVSRTLAETLGGSLELLPATSGKGSVGVLRVPTSAGRTPIPDRKEDRHE